MRPALSNTWNGLKVIEKHEINEQIHEDIERNKALQNRL